MKTLKRILYVEDEPDIRAVTQVALETVGGFELKICSSGEEALDTVISFSPELLLLDVMMPDMDGPTTLTAMRELPELGNIPVIFMTAKVQADEIAELKSLGALDVIAKPFDPMALADQIKSIWYQHHG